MTIAATQALFQELELAVSGGSSSRRVDMLRQITDLFLSDADRLNAAQVGVFDDVLVRLIERVEARALAQLSKRLSNAAGPSQSIRQLALHEDASVAVPVLAKSGQLGDSDLVRIASVRGQEHLLAISSRKKLNEAVTDVLIERGDSQVVRSLAQNGGARFSAAGYSSLVNKAGRDDGLAEKLGLRLDIPVALLRDLLARASEAVKARLLKAAPPEMLEKIRSAIDDVLEDLESKARPVDYTAAEAAVLALNRAGNLNDSAVNRFAIDQNYNNVIAAVSLLASVSIDAIEPLLANSRLEGLAVACKAARLSWSTTHMIIRNRRRCAPPATQELEQLKENFETLSLSVAQRIIRFWSARSAVGTREAAMLQGSKAAGATAGCLS